MIIIIFYSSFAPLLDSRLMSHVGPHQIPPQYLRTTFKQPYLAISARPQVEMRELPTVGW